MNSVRYLSRRLFGSLALSTTLATTLGLTTALGVIGTSAAQETIKIGLIVPMTGPSASTGRQQEAAAKLFIQQKGSTVAGKKIELIVKDDTGAPDTTKRLAQELIVNDKASVLLGFGLTQIVIFYMTKNTTQIRCIKTFPTLKEIKSPLILMNILMCKMYPTTYWYLPCQKLTQ
jgi:hypothetical protein